MRFETAYPVTDFMLETPRRETFYVKYIKRFLDIVCAALALLVFSWLYLIVAILVRINLGAPVIFKQPRPGKISKTTGKERMFLLYKFRTMTDKRDENGELLPDSERLTKFGKFLRSTSLDEIPEAINILKGDMSVVGPRPQLVSDMEFMTHTQRLRHTVRPGLSGLAQISGRNLITWEEKLDYDLKYIEHITFLNDVKIILKTVFKSFVKKEGITSANCDTAEDLGDYLLKIGAVDQEKYNQKQHRAKSIIK